MLGESDRAPREVWICCHGYGQLAAAFLKRFEPLDDGSRLIVAPEGLSRFYLQLDHSSDARVGATWMTREDRLAEIADYVAYLDALHDAVFARVDRKAARLSVLGFSQGTATVSRWVAAGRVKPDRVILWGGLLPPDLDLDAAKDALARLELVLVAGRRDRFVDDAKLSAQIAALERIGTTPRVVRHAGGHRIRPEVLAQLAS